MSDPFSVIATLVLFVVCGVGYYIYSSVVLYQFELFTLKRSVAELREKRSHIDELLQNLELDIDGIRKISLTVPQLDERLEHRDKEIKHHFEKVWKTENDMQDKLKQLAKDQLSFSKEPHSLGQLQDQIAKEVEIAFDSKKMAEFKELVTDHLGRNRNELQEELMIHWNKLKRHLGECDARYKQAQDFYDSLVKGAKKRSSMADVVAEELKKAPKRKAGRPKKKV